jgi:hypothetical protein
MAYLGRKGASAALTSADIPDNSITTAKIVDDNVTAAKIPAGAVSSDVLYLENNTSTQTLSGTYSTERLYFNDSYQLTGDVTVTGHLALGTVADADVVITNDSSARTITGSGTLESGELLSSKETDLTGMTGVLGSVVTGSPNLNLTTGTLGSGVTFPTGHVIKHSVYPIAVTAHVYCNSTSYIDTGFQVIHNTKLSSTDSFLLLEFCSGMFVKATGATAAQIDFTMTTSSNTTHAQANSIIGDASNYNFYRSGQYGTTYTVFNGRAYIGLVSGMNMTTNKASWTAGEALYFRMFGKVGTGSFRVTHVNSTFCMSITEIAR